MISMFYFFILIHLVSNTFATSTSAPKFNLTSTLKSNTLKVVPNAFIIQIESNSTGSTTNLLSKFKRQNQNVLNTTLEGISNAGINFTIRQTFDQTPNLFHGASLQVQPGTNLTTLLAVPGVKNIWPVRLLQSPRSYLSPDENEPSAAKFNISNPLEVQKLKRRTSSTVKDSFSPHMMTGVNAAHEKGFIGTGVKVGIIDTGVDYTNPILGGCFGPGCHISFGTDFVGDSYNGADIGPHPDSDPFSSCRPHGTHVTGIMAALPNQFGFNGVAYGAEFGMYKVNGCSDFVGEDILLAALMLAHVDNCQVISISIGGPGGWIKGTPTEILVDQLTANNVVVVIAAGNSQSEGLFFSSEPASTANAFSVASVEVLDLIGYAATVNTNQSIPVLSILPLALTGNLEIYFTNLNTHVPDDACKPLHPNTPDLSGKVVIVQRGTCDFDTKLYNVLAFGGTTVLFFNGLTSTNVLPYPQPDWTGVTVVGGLFRSDGLALLKLYKAQLAGGSVVTMSFPPGPVIPNLRDDTAGGLISFFSNFGPSNDLYGQPNIAAPGGLILSTYPVSFGTLGLISGTSMATPFISGAVAVLLSARASENLTPLQVRSILSSTSKLVSTQLSSDTPYTSTLLQGGGLVQLDLAIASRSIITPNEFLLNDTANFKGNQTLTIINRNKFPVTYTFSSLSAETRLTYDNTSTILPSLFPPAIETPPALVKFSTKSLNIQPGATSSVQCFFTVPQFDAATVAAFPVYSGWVKIQEHGYSSDGSSKVMTYTVPYFGVANAMVNMPIFDTTGTLLPGFKFPFLYGQFGVQKVEGYTYGYGAGPIIYTRLAAGTLLYSIDLVQADITFRGTVPTDNNQAPTTGTKKRSTSSQRLERDNTVLSFEDLEFGHNLVSNTSIIRPTYDSIPIIGNIETNFYQSRDERVSGQDPNAPFTAEGLYFRDGYTLNGKFHGIYGGNYRFLIRVLKINGDAKYQDQYESWVSPSFKK